MQATELCQALHTAASLRNNPLDYFTELSRQELARLAATINRILAQPDSGQGCQCRKFLQDVRRWIQGNSASTVQSQLSQDIAQKIFSGLSAIAQKSQDPTVPLTSNFPGLPSRWIQC